MDRRLLLPTPEHLLTDEARQGGNFDRPVVLVGSTPLGRVTVYADSKLGNAGVTFAKQVLSGIQADYDVTQGWFGNVALPTSICVASKLSQGSDGSGGAYHYGCNAATLYCDASYGRPERTLALFVAELSEVGQAVQGGLWNCGDTNGESLSRLHAELSHPGALNDFRTVPAWLAQGTPDWISQNVGNDTDPVANGCGVCFLWWLVYLGYSVRDITAAGSPTLAGTYQKLTGKLASQAYSDFMTAVRALPLTSLTSDNPWGSAPPIPPTPTKMVLTLAQATPAGTYTLGKS